MNDFNEHDPETAKLRARLQRAVRSQAAPPFLEAGIRHAVRSRRSEAVWGRLLAPALAMAAAVVLGGTIAYQSGYLRWSAGSQESYIASVSSQVATLMRVGLGDHLHCAVFRKYPQDPPPVEELAAKLGPEYRGLILILRRQAPAEDFRLVIAHECRYHGRQFVHLSLKSNSRVVSLLVTRKREGESFEADTLVPALVQTGIPVYRASAQRFQIASFETRDHLVYLVSDLTAKQNLSLMATIARPVRELFASIEG